MEKENVVLAEMPGFGRIHICECESIHMTVGPVTINLAPAAFAQAAIMIRDAMEQLAMRSSTMELQSETLSAADGGAKKFLN